MPFTFKLSQRLARLKSAVVLAAGATLIACQRPARVTDINGTTVTQLVVSPHSITLAPSATQQFAVFGRTTVGDSLPVAVQWSALGGSITPGGLYTAAQAPGSYHVVALQVGGVLADTAAVTVILVPVASVAVSPSTSSVLLGGTVQLTATPQDSAGSPLTGRLVTWSTSASAVATVDANGLVTGVAGGAATITATSEGKSGTATITVSGVPVASVAVSPASASVFVGGTVQLTATPQDSAGGTLAGRAVAWSSSATGVATVSSSGRVTGASAGTATITATSEGKSGSATVTVNIVPVASVTVSPATADIFVGGTVRLTATPRDSAGGALPSRPVTWSSSATAVATVSGAGTVTGVSAGTATITATSEGKSGAAAITVTQPSSSHAGYYVSPSGSSAGDGSVTRPWDLGTAFSGAGGKIQPGDTVWLRGGTYPGGLTSSLNGRAGAPIIVRQYPGERAIIDGGSTPNSGITVDGSWTWYWGFEITNSSLTRVSTGIGLRHAGVYVRNAANVKLINLIVHDTGHGTYVENGAPNIEIYGWIIYNGGNVASTRGDGHGIYIRNDGTGTKLVRDNVIFNQWGFGLHGYAESGDQLKRMTFEGNVAFNNGYMSGYSSPNLIIGGQTAADADTVRDNMFYYSPGLGPRNIRIGYDPAWLNAGIDVERNYVVGGTQVADFTPWQALTFKDNTLIGGGTILRLNQPTMSGVAWGTNGHYRDPAARSWGYGGTDYAFTAWQTAAGVGGNDQITTGAPTATRVFVRPNQYEPGRAHVIIYNWAILGSVAVDLSGVLRVGDRYEVRSVQNLVGTPVVSGTYGGGTINIPMLPVTPPVPIGGSSVTAVLTGPAFDVFLVQTLP